MKQKKYDAARNIHDQLLSLVEIAEGNHLPFIAYVLKMALHEASELTGDALDLPSDEDHGNS
jgi:dihydrodipicolinate synthase/N-acetylneuraminate lyase